MTPEQIFEKWAHLPSEDDNSDLIGLAQMAYSEGAKMQAEKDANNRTLCPVCQKNLEETPP